MLDTILHLIRSEPWQVAVEIGVLWACVYLVYRFLRGTRGAGALKGFAVLLVIGTLLIRVLGQSSDAFDRLAFIYDRFLGLVAVLLVVVFQPELRQAMIRLGQAWSFGGGRGAARTIATTVAEASIFLSKAQFGALIAIERRTRLGGLIETGTTLDAIATPALLESIFWPNSPLHDLGVIVRGDRIVAANVQFPLAEEGMLDRQHGSRHRAAAGLSLESDALVVVVSEETGRISLVENGVIDGGIERDELEEEILRRLSMEPEEVEEVPHAAPAPEDDDDAPETAGSTADAAATDADEDEDEDEDRDAAPLRPTGS